MGLAGTVARDIEAFVEQQRELMFNEGDFQLQLAVYLKQQSRYDEVQVEYFIPHRLAADAGYDWDSNLYIDIVVRKGERYCPIELKYPTEKVVTAIRRFGITIDNAGIMKQQGAQNIIKYNYWKDVRRLEIIRKLFPDAVEDGVAVMLTNDRSYTLPSRESSACAPFAMDGSRTVGGTLMDWNGEVKIRDTHRPFVLDRRYQCRWTEHDIGGVTFYLNILTI